MKIDDILFDLGKILNLSSQSLHPKLSPSFLKKNQGWCLAAHKVLSAAQALIPFIKEIKHGRFEESPFQDSRGNRLLLAEFKEQVSKTLVSIGVLLNLDILKFRQTASINDLQEAAGHVVTINESLPDIKLNTCKIIAILRKVDELPPQS